MKDRGFKIPPRFWECCGQMWGGEMCGKCGKHRPICGNKSNLNVPPRDGLPTDLREMLKKEPSKRKTPRGQGMNAGEKKVFLVLKAEHPEAKIIPKGIRLAFDNGDTYLADFAVFHPTGKIELIEVKGGARGSGNEYRGPGWEQGWERWERAREFWGKWFSFRMMYSSSCEVLRAGSSVGRASCS